MKILYAPLISLLCASSLGFAAENKVSLLNQKDMKYVAGPEGLPKGAMVAVLQGDPTVAGPVTIRLKFPANYRVPTHTHPTMETLTIISGSLRMSYGEALETGRFRTLSTGGFFVLPPNTPHRVTTVEPTVIQLTTEGPFAINYTESADDDGE